MKKYRSDHFLVSDRVLAPVTTTGVTGSRDSCVSLQFAVPKKLLKRAVDRNAVRRVARESWRAALVRSDWSEQYLLRCHELRFRLLARPAGLAEMSRPARKRFWRQELDGLLRGILK